MEAISRDILIEWELVVDVRDINERMVFWAIDFHLCVWDEMKNNAESYEYYKCPSFLSKKFSIERLSDTSSSFNRRINELAHNAFGISDTIYGEMVGFYE